MGLEVLSLVYSEGHQEKRKNPLCLPQISRHHLVCWIWQPCSDSLVDRRSVLRSGGCNRLADFEGLMGIIPNEGADRDNVV